MQYITTGHAAKMFGVGVNTIKRWIQSGELEAIVTPGGHWRILESDFRRLLAARSATSVVSAVEAPVAAAYKVLIVDDDPMMCEYVKGTLDVMNLNHQIDCAHDGYSGLIKIGTMQPDMVILDIMLPEINGLEIIHRLRGNPDLNGTPRVLAITGAGDHRMVRKALESAKPDATLLKPIRQDLLISTISRLAADDGYVSRTA